MTTLTRRKIDLTFSLGSGNFGEGKPDTIELSGYRTSATITETGGVMQSEMQLRVWGLPLDIMRKLTVLQRLAYRQMRNNTVSLRAGDESSGTSLVFNGTINEAWIDASGAPEIVFVVSAYSNLMASIKPIPPTSFKGPVSAEMFFSSLAKQITEGGQSSPYALENGGVTGTLDSPYYPGTALAQMLAGARALNINLYVDGNTRTVAIWPAGGARGTSVVDVSPETGLIGYPQFTQNGIAFSMLYQPSLIYGQRVKVTSGLGVTEVGQDLGITEGIWVVAAVQHNLDAELPGGQWFTRVECGLLGHPAPIIGTPS